MPADGRLRDVIQNGATYDAILLEKEMVNEAVNMMDEVEGEERKIGAIVLECTQMPPFAKAIQQRTGVPVYDVYTLGTWFYAGLVRQTPPMWKNDLNET